MKAMGLQQDGKTGVPVWHKSENVVKHTPVFRKKRDRKGENAMLSESIKKLVQYGGFSHSEAKGMIDFLKEAGVDYKQSIGEDGRISFLLAENKEYIFKNAMDTIKQEETTEVGKKHFVSQNLYWRYAINQASKALNHDGVVFLGSEAGTRGIRVESIKKRTFYSKK